MGFRRVGDAIGSLAKRRLARIHEVLSRSVELRLRSDVPLGAFLSGGIDSSAIVGLMKQATEQRIATFSVTFNEGEFDESPYSRLIAERFDTDHHEIRLTPMRSSKKCLRRWRRWTTRAATDPTRMCEQGHEICGDYGGFERPWG